MGSQNSVFCPDLVNSTNFQQKIISINWSSTPPHRSRGWQLKNHFYLQMWSYHTISSSTDARQVCQFICLIWAHWNQLCDQKHWYTHTSHYWYIRPSKYACNIARLLQSTHILYITAHIKNNKLQHLFTMLLPYMCYQQICPSNAMPIGTLASNTSIPPWVRHNWITKNLCKLPLGSLYISSVLFLYFIGPSFKYPLSVVGWGERRVQGWGLVPSAPSIRLNQPSAFFWMVYNNLGWYVCMTTFMNIDKVPWDGPIKLVSVDSFAPKVVWHFVSKMLMSTIWWQYLFFSLDLSKSIIGGSVLFS